LFLHLTAIITVTIVRLVGQIKSRTYGGEERGGRGKERGDRGEWRERGEAVRCRSHSQK
jgi:hypothetical protein